jgi:tetratricopeptide (TPR) repeat protein
MEPSDLDKRRAEKLTEAGHRCLRDGDPDGALKVAAQLEELRYTATFELAALAHVQRGDLDAAIAVLRRGLEIAPLAWPNWQLLGNTLSDLRRYEEAALAYEQALECPDARPSSIRLNQAILASRRGMPDQALMYLDQVQEPALALPATGVRVQALVEAGRSDEALRIGEALLDDSPSDEPQQLACLAAAVGKARRARGATPEAILAFALDALDRYDRNNPQLLALIRAADNQRSPRSRHFRLTVDAKIPFRDPLSRMGKGYVVTYDVVAESIEQALGFVERMESPAVRGNLQVDEHEIIDDSPGDPQGVYRRTAPFYYERDD